MGKPLPAEQKEKYHNLCQAWQDAQNHALQDGNFEDITTIAAVKQARVACEEYQSQLEKDGYEIEYFCNPTLGSKTATYLKWNG